MPTSLVVIVSGIAFVGGFTVGSAVFSRALRQRERRLTNKAKAIESARRYLLRHGIDLPTWVASVVDQERPARRPWWWRRRRNDGKHHV